MIRSYRFRWLVAAALAVVVAGAGLRLALLDGWLRTVRIDGPSMAPTLCGAHLAVSCSDCGFQFRADSEHQPDVGRLVCPNCGFRDIEAARQQVRAGDTVLVDRWPHLTRRPQRWEVVACSDPRTGEPAVKRIAGLPGETITIQEGDLYADGKIVRKSLDEFWQSAVLVHDDADRPRSLAGSGAKGFLRWQPRSASSQWQVTSSGYHCQPADDADAHEPDWLEYVHWRCDASLTPRDAPALVLDNDAYNQAMARRLNVVHDLVLACQVELPAESELTIAFPWRKKLLAVRIKEGKIDAEEAGRPLATVNFQRHNDDRPLTIVAGQFDAQLVAAVDGREAVRLALDGSAAGEEGTAVEPRMRIASQGTAVVRNLQVWRDIHLLEPHGTARIWSADHPLSADEYFLLGDNPPVSIDSRHWKAAGIPRQRLRGVVLGPQRRIGVGESLRAEKPAR